MTLIQKEGTLILSLTIICIILKMNNLHEPMTPEQKEAFEKSTGTLLKSSNITFT